MKRKVRDFKYYHALRVIQSYKTQQALKQLREMVML